MSLGLKHSCALTVDHKITCWGLNFHAQSNPHFNSTVENSDSYYSYVTTGHFHTCAINTVTLPGTDLYSISNNEGIKIKTEEGEVEKHTSTNNSVSSIPLSDDPLINLFQNNIKIKSEDKSESESK